MAVAPTLPLTATLTSRLGLSVDAIRLNSAQHNDATATDSHCDCDCPTPTPTALLLAASFACPPLRRRAVALRFSSSLIERRHQRSSESTSGLSAPWRGYHTIRGLRSLVRARQRDAVVGLGAAAYRAAVTRRQLCALPCRAACRSRQPSPVSAAGSVAASSAFTQTNVWRQYPPMTFVVDERTVKVNEDERAVPSPRQAHRAASKVALTSRCRCSLCFVASPHCIFSFSRTAESRVTTGRTTALRRPLSSLRCTTSRSFARSRSAASRIWAWTRLLLLWRRCRHSPA